MNGNHNYDVYHVRLVTSNTNDEGFDHSRGGVGDKGQRADQYGHLDTSNTSSDHKFHDSFH